MPAFKKPLRNAVLQSDVELAGNAFESEAAADVLVKDELGRTLLSRDANGNLVLTGRNGAGTAVDLLGFTVNGVATLNGAALATAADVTGLLDYKGAFSASGNPNYPTASKGDSYTITVAGIVGGGSGKTVAVGDLLVATADNAGGTEASVGTSWIVLEANIAGITPAGLSMVQAADVTAQRVLLSLATTDRPNFANVQITHGTLSYDASVVLDFDGNGFQTVTLTGVIEFTTSNLAAGRSKTVRIIGDSSERALTFPAGWTFVGAAAPATLAANKDAVLTLTSFGTTDANVVAAYAVEP